MSVLTRPTLILNKSWHPIDSTTVEEAFKVVCADRGVFLNLPDYTQHDMVSWMDLPVNDEDEHILHASGRIKVPEIMLLSEFNRLPERKVVFCRRNLWRRDRRRCQYCGIEPRPDEITIDHIHPRSKGGLSTFENCVLCCVKCNLQKGNKDLADTGMRLRRMKKLPDGSWKIVFYDNPTRPVWNPLYALRRKTYPKSWAAFLKNFDESLYWEVELED